MENKINFRKDIQGLRGLSVILVLIYHTKFFFNDKLILPGGLYGVDIFFVISGFIITLVINNSLKNNYFCIFNFYIKRCRRLLPVLFFVILIIFSFYKFLLPVDLVDYAKSALNLLVTNANYYFYSTSTNYGEQRTLLRPLVHVWTLCVEFQFYILFPIFYLIIFKNYRRHLVLLILLGIAVDFIVANYLTFRSPNFSFYLLPSRGWEFLVGVLVANLKLKNNKYFNQNSKIFSNVGLLMIFYSVIFYSENNFNPGLFNMFPVLGSALIIFFSQKNFVGYILSSRILVFFGTLSYSIYLWHYPILAFFRYTELIDENQILKKIFLLLVIFILSFFTYRLIEKPFRNIYFISNKFFNFLIIALFLLIGFISYVVIKNDGFPNRLKNYQNLYSSLIINKFPDLLDENDNSNCFGKQNNFCIYNKNGKKGKVYLIGDSHIRNIASVLKNDLVKMDYEIQIMADRDCWYSPGFGTTHSLTGRELEFCTYNYHNSIKNILTKEKNATIIFGGRLPRYLSNKVFNNKEGGIESDNFTFQFTSKIHNKSLFDNIKLSIKDLSLNNNIIFIYPVPEAGWDIHKKIFNYFNLKFNLNKNEILDARFASVSFYEYLLRSKKSFHLLDGIIGKNVFRIYPHKFICDNFIKKRCVLHYGGNMYYLDNNHPSLFFSKLIALEVKNVILKIKEK